MFRTFAEDIDPPPRDLFTRTVADSKIRIDGVGSPIARRPETGSGLISWCRRLACGTI